MQSQDQSLYFREHEQNQPQLRGSKLTFQVKEIPSAPKAPPVYAAHHDREEEERQREGQEERQEVQTKQAKKVEHKEDLNKDHMTAMEKHCEFFDRNKDGMIYPKETFEGLRAIGFGIPVAIFGTFIIHFTFFVFAARSWPNPRFGLNLKMMHRCKHGSDSEVYDHSGRMSKEKLDEIFTRYSDRQDSIHVRDIYRMTQDKWEALDFFGWIAEKFEWGFFALLVAEKGRISREDIEGQFDGTLFYKLEERNKAKRSNKKKTQ